MHACIYKRGVDDVMRRYRTICRFKRCNMLRGCSRCAMYNIEFNSRPEYNLDSVLCILICVRIYIYMCIIIYAGIYTVACMCRCEVIRLRMNSGRSIPLYNTNPLIAVPRRLYNLSNIISLACGVVCYYG